MKRTFFLTFNQSLTLMVLPLFAALSACGDDEAAIAAAQKAALVGNKIECALNGSDSFSLNCATERVGSENGTILMIRHSDGGFRRFRILTDGRGLETAEGFDDTSIEILDDEYIILSSGIDRYKLKAQFTGGDNPSNALPSIDSAEDESTDLPVDNASESLGSGSDLSDSDVGPTGTPGAPYAIPR